jgi:hypothetical protein
MGEPPSMSETRVTAREGGIEAAISAILTDARRAHEKRLAVEAVRQWIRDTDEMITELEELNLLGMERVSDSWRPRLVALFVSLPFQPQVRIPARPSPTQLLDALFSIQQDLLDIKNAHLIGVRPTLVLAEPA